MNEQMNEELNGEEIQVISAGAIESIERAQVDQQIATAKRYPRPVKTESIRQQIMLHACVDEDTARECYYVLPRGGGTLDGPSVRLSEIVAAAYKNLHVAGRIIDHDSVHRTVTAQAVAWDLESNVRRTAEWSEPILQKSSDAVKITKLVAISKAERNAIFKVVPKSIYNPVVKRCIQIVAGDIASLATRRSKMVKAFSGWGIVIEQILGVFGYEALEQITGEDFAKLEGMYTAIKEGIANIDEIFKPVARKTPEGNTPPASTVDNASQSQGVSEPPKRGRGRPPGSTKAAKEEPKKEEINETQTSDIRSESAVQPSDAPSEEQVGSNSVGTANSTIALIRAELERTGKSEQRLLSVLHTWKLTANPAMQLDDIDEQTLQMVFKRWETVTKNL